MFFEHTDQLGRAVILTQKPKRIISLVPSQTELLFDLGLNEELIGITKFCVHPKVWFNSKTRIGGTKTLDLKKIIELQPDLIIGNKEENEKSQIELLMQDFPVWMSDISNLPEAIQMILSIGKILNRERQSNEIIEKIQHQFGQLSGLKHRTCAYLIWKKPYMCAGKNTFIDDMLQRCNLKNVFSNEARYPEIAIEDLKKSQPEFLLLSSEPYPFKVSDVEYLKSICPYSKVILVDGELFSWYGSRLINSAAYFNKIFSTELN